MEIIDGVSFLDHVRRGAAQPRHQADQTTVNVTSSVLVGPSTLRSTPPLAATVASAPTPSTRLDAPACSVEVLRPALRQLLLGVAAIHGAGQLHRDLKPSNVLRDRRGARGDPRLRPGDGAQGRRAQQATGRRVIVGTPEYMAPEQASGDPGRPCQRPLRGGADALRGADGAAPFVGDMRQILLASAGRTRARPTASPPELPEDLVTDLRGLPAPRARAAAHRERAPAPPRRRGGQCRGAGSPGHT